MKPLVRVIPLCLAVLAAGPCLAHAGPVFSEFISFDAPGATGTFGNAVNSGLNVAGSFTDSTGATRGFERFADGTFNSPIIAPGDNQNFTRALGINNSGTVVGDYLNFDGSTLTFHGYLLNGSTFTQYDHGGPFSTTLSGINNAGHLVGTFGSTVQANQGFLDVGGGPIDFSSAPGATATFGDGINDSDQVVGQFFDTNNVSHGYLRDTNGAITTLDVPGSTATAASGINDGGDIVGWYTDASGATHGFIRDPAMFFTFDFPNAATTRIFGIDNHGDITGDYFDSTGVEHGFLAVAVPEPSSVVLLSLGSLGLAGYAWRRRRLRTVG